MGYAEDAARYAALAQRLDELRRGAAAHAMTLRQEAETGRATLDQLVDRLTEQQAQLHIAARRLRLRMPVIDPAPSNALTAREALSLAQAAADTSDREREFAIARAQQPRWLPDKTPLVRNMAVYAACAGACLLVQLVLFLVGDGDTVTTVLWAFLGLPTIAWFVGYLLIGIVGVPRIPPEPQNERDALLRSGRTSVRTRGARSPAIKPRGADPDRHPRLGAAICFATLPVCWVLLSLIGSLFS